MKPDIISGFSNASLQGDIGISEVGFKGFDQSTIDFFKSLLGQYKYGKDLNLLLEPARGFKVVYCRGKDPSVLLRNYTYGDISQGICGEVSHSYGRQALKSPEIRNKYDIVQVFGSVTGVFSRGHAFLLIAPKDLNIKHLLDRGNNIFPEGAVLTDPSLGTFEYTSKLNTREGHYKLDSSISYQDIQDPSGDWSLALRPDDFSPIVIGFMRDYIPVTNPENENRLLYLAFEISNGNEIPTVNFLVHDSKTNAIELINLENFPSFGPDSKQVGNLKKLLEKVKSDLRSS